MSYVSQKIDFESKFDNYGRISPTLFCCAIMGFQACAIYAAIYQEGMIACIKNVVSIKSLLVLATPWNQ
jgi:hypothetical protein